MAPAVDTIPVSPEVAQRYATSSAQTQQTIQNLLRQGLGLSQLLAPAEEVSSSLSLTRVLGSRAAYDADFYAWTQATAARIRAGHWEGINRETLAEEVEDLGVSQYNAVSSDLYQVLIHLLKWQYQPDLHRDSHSWRDSIAEHRDRIDRLCTRSRSLRPQLPTTLTDEYPRARRRAQYQTGLPLETFPTACPWTIAQILDPDFWPEAPGG